MTPEAGLGSTCARSCAAIDPVVGASPRNDLARRSATTSRWSAARLAVTSSHLATRGRRLTLLPDLSRGEVPDTVVVAVNPSGRQLLPGDDGALALGGRHSRGGVVEARGRRAMQAEVADMPGDRTRSWDHCMGWSISRPGRTYIDELPSRWPGGGGRIAQSGSAADAFLQAGRGLAGAGGELWLGVALDLCDHFATLPRRPGDPAVVAFVEGFRPGTGSGARPTARSHWQALRSKGGTQSEAQGGASSHGLVAGEARVTDAALRAVAHRCDDLEELLEVAALFSEQHRARVWPAGRARHGIDRRGLARGGLAPRLGLDLPLARLRRSPDPRGPRRWV